jgi:hypothetical protein
MSQVQFAINVHAVSSQQDFTQLVRRQAGGRPYRSDALLQWVVIGRGPADAAEEIVAGASGALTVEQSDRRSRPVAPRAGERYGSLCTLPGADDLTPNFFTVFSEGFLQVWEISRIIYPLQQACRHP